MNATVLLQHVTALGLHFDWLIDVSGPPALLWTARTATPTWRWGELGHWRLERIADHRRRYLRFEGMLTGGRGWVRRVDEGSVALERWTAREAVLQVRMRRFAGRVRLERAGAHDWRATRL